METGSAAGRVAVGGASGFVGRALCRSLTRRGTRVVAIARDEGPLQRVDAAEWVAAGVDTPEVAAALAGCRVAYYLVHSLGAGGGARDVELATAFGRAAAAAGTERVVFLGAPVGDGSSHLEGRSAVADALAKHGPPLSVVRAGAVLGAGSLPFEVLRACVELAPVLILTRFASLPTDVSTLDDAVDALVQAGEAPAVTDAHVPTISGADFEMLLRGYARARGLRRWFVRVPGVPHAAVGVALGAVARIVLPSSRAAAARELIASTRVALAGSGASGARERTVEPSAVLADALRVEAEAFDRGELPEPGRHGGVVSLRVPPSGRRRLVVLWMLRRAECWLQPELVVVRPRGLRGIAWCAVASLAAAAGGRRVAKRSSVGGAPPRP